VKIDKKLNIYQLRDDLEKGHSALRVVPVSVIEKVPSFTNPQTSDQPVTVVQRQP